MKIRYWDRETNTIREEKVAGEKYIKWLYESSVGQGFLEAFIKSYLVFIWKASGCKFSSVK